jgi:hypothetical protein
MGIGIGILKPGRHNSIEIFGEITGEGVKMAVVVFCISISAKVFHISISCNF